MLKIIEDVKFIIDNIDYRKPIPTEVAEMARENGLVIVYGASDDLLEIEGAVYDELGAYDGFNYDDMEGPDYSVETYDFLTKHKIEMVWCPDETKSWNFKVGNKDSVFSTFNIMEDGEVYCEGIIILK